MKTTIGIICIIAPTVLAYWDIIGPAIKNFITNQKTIRQ